MGGGQREPESDREVGELADRRLAQLAEVLLSLRRQGLGASEVRYLSVEQWDAYRRAADLDELRARRLVVFAAAYTRSRGGLSDILAQLDRQEDAILHGNEFTNEDLIESSFGSSLGKPVEGLTTPGAHAAVGIGSDNYGGIPDGIRQLMERSWEIAAQQGARSPEHDAGAKE